MWGSKYPLGSGANENIGGLSPLGAHLCQPWWANYHLWHCESSNHSISNMTEQVGLMAHALAVGLRENNIRTLLLWWICRFSPSVWSAHCQERRTTCTRHTHTHSSQTQNIWVERTTTKEEEAKQSTKPQITHNDVLQYSPCDFQVLVAHPLYIAHTHTHNTNLMLRYLKTSG
jgi:hypothetical protein